MRFPNLSDPSQLPSAWAQMIRQYEKDYQGLRAPSVVLTLTVSATSTTLSHPALRPTSGVQFSPMSANATAAYDTTYFDTPTQGQVVFHHASNAQTDRNFLVTITNG